MPVGAEPARGGAVPWRGCQEWCRATVALCGLYLLEYEAVSLGAEHHAIAAELKDLELCTALVNAYGGQG